MPVLTTSLTRPRRCAATATVALAVLAGSTATASAATAAPRTTGDSAAVARGSAAYLAGKVGSDGAVRVSGRVSPDGTVGTALALESMAAAGALPGGGLRATRRAEAWALLHTDQIARDEQGRDKAGSLAQLVLLERRLSARDGGRRLTALVQRLRATQRRSGGDAGLYGAQDPTYDGAYRQGLALAALAGVGRRDGLGLHWLRSQECSDGGWVSYRADVSVACAGSAEDTNSTALGVTGLAANRQGVGAALQWLKVKQLADGSWDFTGSGVAGDADSTAVVVQSVLAAGQDPRRGVWVKPGGAAGGALARFRAPGGGFVFQAGGSANLLATQQAVPAALGLAFPLPDPVRGRQR